VTFWDRANENTPLAPLREIDYKALRLMLERCPGPSHSKKKQLKHFDRSWKRGQLFYCKEETAFQKWIRCEARFVLGDYSDWSGWQFRDRWSEKIWFNNPFKVPVWKTDYVEKLYVIGEQGIGDEILLSQTILDAKKRVGKVVLETQLRLQPIFERSLGVDTSQAIVGADGIRRAQPFEADAWVSLGELPRLFRKSRESFVRKPYITVLPSRCAEVEQYRGRVGISWRGAQGRVDWRKLLKLYPNAISLQYDQAEEEVEKPHIDLRNDLEGILALLSVLDKVVTVSTTVAHMAAASGVKMDLVIADPQTGIRNNILPWRWLDLSCKTIPRRSQWYGDHVSVYTGFSEYYAHTR
jgi:hypothetical protein